MRSEEAQLAHHFPLRQIADRAGVEDQQVGSRLILSARQATLLKLAHHDLGVELIHLAAVGTDVKGLRIAHM